MLEPLEHRRLLSAAPLVTRIPPDVLAPADSRSTAIPFQGVFWDADDLPASLVYTVEAERDPLFAAPPSITARGELLLPYAPHASGTAQILVRATDPLGLYAETAFTVTVPPSDDAGLPDGMPADGGVLGETGMLVSLGDGMFPESNLCSGVPEGMTSPSASGEGSVVEGSPYQLYLDAGTGTGPWSVTGWSVDWGDAQSQQVEGSPGCLAHVFAGSAADPLVVATPAYAGYRAGGLDPDFGSGGTTGFSATLGAPADIATADGHALFAAGNVTRLDSAGAADLVIDVSQTIGEARAAAVDAQARILVAGSGLAVARYLADGTTLDTTFDTGGIAGPGDLSGDTPGHADHVLLLPDGKILVAGYIGVDVGWGSARYDLSLLLYGSEGGAPTVVRVSQAFGNTDAYFAYYGYYGWGSDTYDVSLHNGGILVALTFGDGRVGLARFALDGSLDTAFGDQGTVQGWDSAYGVVSGLAVAPDSTILVAAGPAGGSSYYGGIQRYRCGGQLDTAFGSGGSLSVGIASLGDVAVQPDGKIVVAGANYDFMSAPYAAVRRYDAYGIADEEFNSANEAAASFSAGAEAIAVQPDGGLLVAGGNVSLARYLNSSVPLQADPSVVPVHVANVAPFLSDFADVTRDEGQSLDLWGSFTDPGIGESYTCQIAWGDGFTASGAVTIDTYGQPGIPTAGSVAASHTYLSALDVPGTVTVTLSDGDGGEIQKTFAVTVANVAPADLALSLGSASVYEGEQVVLTGSFTDPGTQEAHTVTIAWGDGPPETLSLEAGASASFNASHWYADEGQFSIEVTVSDGRAATAPGVTSVTVANAPPANLSVWLDPASPEEGEDVVLCGSFTDPGALDSHTVVISWGDGQQNDSSMALAPGQFTFECLPIRYADDGPYTVTVTVADDDGGRGEGAIGAEVANAAPVPALEGPAAGDEGTELALTASATDGPADTLAGIGLEWTVTKNGELFDEPGNGAAVRFTPDDNGTYVVTLTATDNDGGAASITHTVIVGNVAPQAHISGPATGDEGSDITVLGWGTDAGDADMAAGFYYNWEVTKDGSTVTSESGPANDWTSDGDDAYSFSFTPQDDGLYTVKLTVTDDTIASAEQSCSVNVANVAPEVSISGPNTAAEGASISLSASADDVAADLAGMTFSWSVTSGGVTVPSEHHSSTFDFTPGSTGVFLVSVTATDEDSASDTATQEVYVDNALPTLTVAVDQAAVINQAFSTIVAAYSDPGATDLAYSIDWGDGLIDIGQIWAPVGPGPTQGTIPGAHTYQTYGPHTVTVDLSDAESTVSGSFQVTVAYPQVALQGIVFPQSVPEGGIAELNGRVTGLAGQPFTLHVDWGDGEDSYDFAAAGPGSNASVPFTVRHLYGEDNGPPGTPQDNFYGDVFVTTADGRTSAAVDIAVCVQNQAPTVRTDGHWAGLDTATVTAVGEDPGTGDGPDTWSYSWRVELADHTQQTGWSNPFTFDACDPDGNLLDVIWLSVDVTDDDGGHGWWPLPDGHMPAPWTEPALPEVSITRVGPADPIVGGASAQFTISLETHGDVLSHDVIVYYATDDSGGGAGAATPDLDYVATRGRKSVKFTPTGSRSIPISVNTSLNPGDGQEKTVGVSILSCNGGTVTGAGSVTLTIDQPCVDIDTDVDEAIEAGSPGRILAVHEAGRQDLAEVTLQGVGITTSADGTSVVARLYADGPIEVYTDASGGPDSWLFSSAEGCVSWDLGAGQAPRTTLYVAGLSAGAASLTWRAEAGQNVLASDVVAFTVVSVNETTDSNNDRVINSGDDQVEMQDPGRIVQVHGDRAEVDLSALLSRVSPGKVTARLVQTGGSGTVKVWRDATGPREITPGTVLTFGWAGISAPNVWVEGLTVGMVELSLDLVGGNSARLTRDTVKLYVVDVNIDTDSDNDGEVIHALDDPVEMDNPGKIIELGGGRAEARLSVDFAGADSSLFELALLPGPGSTGSIRLWDDRFGGHEIPIGLPTMLWPVGNLPSTVWVEGTGVGQVELSLLLHLIGSDVFFQDAVKFGIFKLGLDVDANFDLHNVLPGGVPDAADNYMPGYTGNLCVLSPGPTDYLHASYHPQRMQIVVLGLGAQDLAAVNFTLKNRSNYYGFAMDKSSPAVEGADKDWDISFRRDTNGDSSYVTSAPPTTERPGQILPDKAYTSVWAKDFAAWGKVEIALFGRAGGATHRVFTTSLTIPTDADSDGISDRWERDEAMKWENRFATPVPDPLALFGQVDDKEPLEVDGSDSPIVHAAPGDGRTVIQEYRGYILDGGGFDGYGQNATSGGHVRLTPSQKELLVEVDAMAPAPGRQPVVRDRAQVKGWMDTVARAASQRMDGAGIVMYYVVDDLSTPYADLPTPPQMQEDVIRPYLGARGSYNQNSPLRSFTHLQFLDHFQDDDRTGMSWDDVGASVALGSAQTVAGRWIIPFDTFVASLISHELHHTFITVPKGPGVSDFEHFTDTNGNGIPGDADDQLRLMWDYAYEYPAKKLNGNMGIGSYVLILNDTSGLPPKGQVKVDQEYVWYDGIDGNDLDLVNPLQATHTSGTDVVPIYAGSDMWQIWYGLGTIKHIMIRSR